ncbi:MAG: enoyl-CoA hydratase/isomerase family protein, partial [Rhodospirillaceae bacterium]|nr:enoyl-CoA hydratase/isomerase family protein [Rhodospirillaceae bacterium]
MTDLIKIEIQSGVALLTLNNPPMNLATLARTRQMSATLDDLAA